MKLCFYNVDLSYIDYLKKYETNQKGYTRVPNVQYRSGNNKFFYGAVLNINGINYFVPISSKQHNKQDDLPIRTKDKFKREISTLRFAYMLPIPQSCLTYLDISKESNKTRQESLRKELAFCRRNRDKISKQAEKTYYRIINRVSDKLVQNSCDFKLLEKAYNEYVALLPCYLKTSAEGVDLLKQNKIDFEALPSTKDQGMFVVKLKTADESQAQAILRSIKPLTK